VALAVLGGCGSPAPGVISEGSNGPVVDPLPDGPNASVRRVVDGDTLIITNGDRIRLIGIDSPESVQPDAPVECFGPQASNRLMELLPVGTGVRLEYDVDRSDRFGRTLAYVFRRSDGLFINASQIDGGFATTLSIAPNTRYADRFTDLQEQAKADQRGLWGACET
jgi:micrococcal nuclease